MKKAVVLLSSGLDSTVNLLFAKKDYEISMALTFDYGQKAAPQEIRSAKAICAQYKIPIEVIRLDWLSHISKSSLNSKDKSIPVGVDIQMDDLEASQKSAKSVWVPNRNGVFLSIAASYAEATGAEIIIPGFNKEEAATFPDNSKAYIESMEDSLSYSTQHPQVKIKCYTIDMDKKEIVKHGRKLQAPFELMWPCYFDGEELCGSCESCQRFLRARDAV